MDGASFRRKRESHPIPVGRGNDPPIGSGCQQPAADTTSLTPGRWSSWILGLLGFSGLLHATWIAGNAGVVVKNSRGACGNTPDKVYMHSWELGAQTFLKGNRREFRTSWIRTRCGAYVVAGGGASRPGSDPGIGVDEIPTAKGTISDHGVTDDRAVPD